MSKRLLVPGVRELASPRGVVTVELTDADRPWRVKKRVRAENAVMDWWLSANTYQGVSEVRNDDYLTYKPCFVPMAACTNTDFDAGLAISINAGRYGSIPGKWPGRQGSNHMPWFYATSGDATPDSSKPWVMTNSHADGGVTAVANTEQVAPLDNEILCRGTVVPAESYATFDQARFTLEWGTDQGNGIWRTAGLGAPTYRSVGNQQNMACSDLYLAGHGALRDQYGLQHVWRNIGYSTFKDPVGDGYYTQSMHYYSTTELYTVTRQMYIGKFNPRDWEWTYNQIATGIAVSDQGAGICRLNGSLWIVNSSANLYKVQEDFSSSVTVDSTIDLTASIGGDGLHDITTDGTHLYILGTDNVHKVDNTGSYVSSWAHGKDLLEGSSNASVPAIEYDPGMGHLWVANAQPAIVNTTATSRSRWGNINTNDWSSNSDPERVWSFGLDGSQLSYTYHPSYSYTDDAYTMSKAITGMDPQGWVFWGTSCWAYSPFRIYGHANPLGPNTASQALLPSDVEKTSSEALKVVYDFDFTG